MNRAVLRNLLKKMTPASRVIVRADFNVPIKNNQVQDSTRITSSTNTIRQLIDLQPQSIVLLSHLGRPNGVKNPQYSLKPIIPILESDLQHKVTFLPDCVGEEVLSRVQQSKNEIFLCENVRFHEQEQGSRKDSSGKKIKSSPQAIKKFRQSLSKLGNCFVNDAFGAAHRAHSSVVGISHQYKVAGSLMERQLKVLNEFLENSRKPVVVILGGAKVSDKIKLIEKMIDVADHLIIGGGMAYPFEKQILGYNLGSTQIDLPSDHDVLQRVMQKASQKGVKIHLPIDHICAKEMTESQPSKIYVDRLGIDQEWKCFDCGPASVEIFKNVIDQAQDVFMNGPIGVSQIPQFRSGSEGILRAIADRSRRGKIHAIVGGGDSVNLVNKLGLFNDFSHVSTGGGASLQFLQGNKLPGVQILSHQKDLQ